MTLQGVYLEGGVAQQAAVPVTVWSDSSGVWKQVGVSAYDGTSRTYSIRVRVTKNVSFQMRSAADSLRAAAVSNNATPVKTSGSTLALSSAALGATTALASPTSVRVRPVFGSTRVPTAAYRYRAFATTSYIAPRQSNANSLRFRCYRYERLSSGAYKWVLRKSVTPRVASVSTTTTRMYSSLSLPARGKWKVVPFYSGSSALIAAYGVADYITIK